MLIYVIPLILLIVVLLVFKKKQADQASDTTSKKAASAKGKKSSNKKTPQPTQAVEDTVIAVQKKTTPLAADVRSKIEGLISERNFSGAEAQINQALNRDNTQHELYLFLLEIHLQQKDEFAISQLLNHLGGLGLDDILAQAEAKKAAYDATHAKSIDTIDFMPASTAPQQAEPQKSTADFDALMNAEPAVSKTPAFDQLQKELAAKDSALPELKALEPDFSSVPQETAPVEMTEPAVEIKPLEFNLSFDAPAAQPAETAASEAPAVQEQVQEIKPLDFSFSLDTPAAQTEEKQPEVEKTAEAVPEFKFDFSGAETATEEKTETVTEIKPEFSFSLDPAPAEAEPSVEAAAPALNFSFDTAPVAVAEPVQTAPAEHLDDPLAQSFPELLAVNETELNLELAKQYMELGAYDSARELLAEQEQQYSPDQRQQADQLLNQIAS